MHRVGESSIKADSGPGWVWPLLVGLATAFAALLRFSHGGHSLWVDELHTGWVVLGPWHALVQRAALGNHGPVYFAAVKLMVAWLGTDETGLRALSMFCGTLLVPATYAVARLWGVDAPVALAAAVAVALDPQVQWFAQEARPYALLQLGTLGHLALCWWAAGREWSPLRGATWAIVAAVLLAVHLAFVQVLAAQALALLLWYGRLGSSEKKARTLCRLWAAWAAVVLMSLPLWPLAATVVRHRWIWQGVFPPWGQVLMQILQGAVPWGAGLAGGVLVAWVFRRWPGAAVRRTGPGQARSAGSSLPLLLATACVVLGPGAALAGAVSGTVEAFFPRYLTPAHAALGVCWALWTNRLGVPLARHAAALGLGVLALLGWPTARWWYQGQLGRWHFSENWAGAVSRLRNEALPGELVWLAPALVEEKLYSHAATPCLREYLCYPLRSLYWPGPVRVEPVVLADKKAVGGKLWSEVSRAQRCWLLVRGGTWRRDQVLSTVAQAAQKHGLELSAAHVRFADRVHLLRLSFVPGEGPGREQRSQTNGP